MGELLHLVTFQTLTLSLAHAAWNETDHETPSFACSVSGALTVCLSTSRRVSKISNLNFRPRKQVHAATLMPA